MLEGGALSTDHMAHLTGLLCNTHEDKRVEQTLNLAASVCKLGAVQHVQATQRCIDFLWDCVCRVKRKDAGVFSAMAQEKVRRNSLRYITCSLNL